MNAPILDIAYEDLKSPFQIYHIKKEGKNLKGTNDFSFKEPCTFDGGPRLFIY